MCVKNTYVTSKLTLPKELKTKNFFLLDFEYENKLFTTFLIHTLKLKNMCIHPIFYHLPNFPARLENRPYWTRCVHWSVLKQNFDSHRSSQAVLPRKRCFPIWTPSVSPEATWNVPVVDIQFTINIHSSA